MKGSRLTCSLFSASVGLPAGSWTNSTACWRRCGTPQVTSLSSFKEPGALWSAQCRVHERPYVEIPLPQRHSNRSGPQRVADEEAYEAAKEALLQFNLMVRRGIEPDALLYTSLIATMGRAGLEWQAYKLFSRMIESKIRPLPETYVALREATSPSRRRLREDIQTKLEECIAVFPDELAEAELQRQQKEDAMCLAKFEEHLRGELPRGLDSLPGGPPAEGKGALRASDQPDGSPEIGGHEKRPEVECDRTELGGSPTSTAAFTEEQPLPSNVSSSSAPTAAPLGTVHIRNPRDVWNTAQMVETLRGAEPSKAKGAERVRLRGSLEQLHEEELRIFAAVHRQLRHGSKAALVERLLDTVSESTLRAMLARRSHYFRSVEKLLAADLEVLKSTPAGGAREKDEPADVAGDDFPDLSTTVGEKEALQPQVLRTPWGYLRRPTRGDPPLVPQGRQADTTNLERLMRLELNKDELLLLKVKADAGDLDEVPEQLLRRYAFQFRLHWRRKKPLSLLESVSWHLTTFFSLQTVEETRGNGTGPDDSTAKTNTLVVVAASPPPTPALRLQREAQGMTKTLENFEAFRIIAQRTENLQVVDHKEVNLHLHTVQREVKRAERRAADAIRRERHRMDAAALAAAAAHYDGPSLKVGSGHGMGQEDRDRVLGWQHGGCPSEDVEDDPTDSEKKGDNKRPPVHTEEAPRTEREGLPQTTLERSAEEAPERSSREASEEVSLTEEAVKQKTDAVLDELPPWELTAGEDEFDLSTGRFGSPEMGRYRELSDSKIRLLPSKAAQKEWKVDPNLLPTSLMEPIRAATLRQTQYQDAVEQEYQRRLKFTSYRKWDRLLQRAQEKQKKRKAAEEAEESTVVTVLDAEGNSSTAPPRRPMIRPVPASKRLSQLLRRGAERKKVSEALRKQYNRTT